MILQAWNSSQYYVKDVALVGFIVASCAWIVINALTRWKTVKGSRRPSTSDVEKKPASRSKFKKPDRKPGGMGAPQPEFQIIIKCN